MLDFTIGFFRVVAASVSGNTHEVLLNLDAGGSSGDPDQWPEVAIAQKGFGALGLVSFPRKPSRVNGQEMRDDSLAIDFGSGLVPFAYRDLRLNAVYSNPKEGSIALVGYGGGFHSIEDTATDSGDQKASIHVIYAPYEFSGGVPSKAHVITLDTTPGNESVSIVHGDGMAITALTGGKHSITMKNKAGDAYVEVNDDGGILNGNWNLTGSLAIGGITAIPVLLSGMVPSTMLKSA